MTVLGLLNKKEFYGQIRLGKTELNKVKSFSLF